MGNVLLHAALFLDPDETGDGVSQPVQLHGDLLPAWLGHSRLPQPSRFNCTLLANFSTLQIQAFTSW